MVKKLLYTLIFFVCILASCLVTNSVFADSSDSFTYHNTIIDKDVTVIRPSALPEDYKYNFVCYQFFDNIANPWYKTFFVFSNSQILCDVNKVTAYDFLVDVGSNMYILQTDSLHLAQYGYTETKYDLSSESLESSYPGRFSFSNSFGAGLFSSSYSPTVAYANYDVLVYGSENDVLFQKAPQEGATIAELMTSIDFSMVLAEVLKMLPTILIVLIGLIALMKAIKLLYSIFRSA